MSAKDLFFTEDKSLSRAEKRAYAREDLVYNVTEDILVALEDFDVSKKELARRLGKSRSYVTQILSGSRNMTLGTLSDICFALGVKPRVTIQEESAWDSYGNTFEIFCTQEELNVNAGELIRTSENVLGYRDPLEWEQQVA